MQITDKLITRRQLFSRSTALTSLGVGTAAYGFGIEPAFKLNVTRYALRPQHWSNGLKLRIAALSDIHASEPYMSAARIREIVALTNTLDADMIVLLGDYVVGSGAHYSKLAPSIWAAELASLKAPLGVFAVLGNHDWWQYGENRQKSADEVSAALRSANITVLHNQALRLQKDGQAFWLAGLGDQLAFLEWATHTLKGADNLPATLAQITDDAPVVLLAHEPDIFVKVPARVSLTLSGHTHGGQIRIMGWSPIIPSRYGNRFAYGHVSEGGKDLLVTGGLGVSRIPVRIGVPPEIMLVDLA
jgi:uncharacterized protein